MWLRAFVTDVEQIMYPTVQFLLVPLKKLHIFLVSLSNFCLREKRFLKNKEYSTSPTQSSQTKCWLMSIFFALSFLTITQSLLTHLFPMHPLSTPGEHQKTWRFSGVFGGLRKGVLGTKGLILYTTYALCCSSCFT